MVTTSARREFVLRHELGARGRRRFRRQILTPGDDFHAERAADPRDLSADILNGLAWDEMQRAKRASSMSLADIGGQTVLIGDSFQAAINKFFSVNFHVEPADSDRFVARVATRYCRSLPVAQLSSSPVVISLHPTLPDPPNPDISWLCSWKA
jgi:hypothetical protein